MALTSACNTALPVFLGKLVDGVDRASKEEITYDAISSLVWTYLVLMAAAYLVREFLNVLRRYLVENSCTRLEKVMTVKLVSHLMKVDLSTLSHEKVGSLHGRIHRSVTGFIRFLRLSFLDFFPAMLTGFFALLAAVSKESWLGLVMTGVIPVSVFLTIKQLISQKGIRLTLIRSRERMDGTVVEQLSGLDYVRAADTHSLEMARIAKAAEKLRAREIRHHFQMSLFGCAKALSEGFFHIVVVSLAIVLAVRGEATTGDVLTFSILFLNVMAPLHEIHRVIDEGHECSLQVGKLLGMLAEPIDRSFSPIQVREPRLEIGIPLIHCDNVRVEYNTADGKIKRALDGLCLSVHHGETIGVAGPSACGKTTWLRVLMRLVHPAAGHVLVGGVPLDQVSRGAIGRLIGYVGQQPFLFAGSVAANISYGCEGATQEEIHRAAEMACIHDEIVKMPGRYDALLSERGMNLSGGQRQRIALARVFLKNPPIFILDEGTSALDTLSERKVQMAIDAARVDRTVILVAHRLSTLLDADRILVFDNGRIAEAGRYDDLVRHTGVFAKLAKCAGDGHKTLNGATKGHAATFNGVAVLA